MNCQYCNGSGWVSVPQVINGVAYDFSEKCVCSPLPQMTAQEAVRSAPKDAVETARGRERRNLREVGI
jgi:hypothetical protein